MFSSFVSLFSGSWSAESQRCQPCALSTPRSSRPSSSSTQRQSTSSSLHSTKNCSTPTPTLQWPCPSDCLWSHSSIWCHQITKKMRPRLRLTSPRQLGRLHHHLGNRIFQSSRSPITPGWGVKCQKLTVTANNTRNVQHLTHPLHRNSLKNVYINATRPKPQPERVLAPVSWT